MGTIKNSNIPNYFGDGYQKEVTLDNGEKYIIKNSNVPNYFGEGYQQEIVKKDTYDSNKSYGPISSFFGLLFGIPALIIGLIVIGVVGFICIKALIITFSTIFGSINLVF